MIASIYYNSKGLPYEQKAPGLALSVILFLIVCLCGLTILVVRRCIVKGELGGSRCGRIASCVMFIGLWMSYVIVVSLQQYGYI